MVKNNDDFEHIHELEDQAKVLLQNRIIYFFGEINTNSTGNFIAAFKEVDSKTGPITVNICSSGGWVEGGLCMYDIIRSSKNKVVTISCGATYSSAILPFEAGDFRVMHKSSRLFFHDMSLCIGEVGLKSIKSAVNETNKLYDMYCDYIANRANLNSSIINSLCQKDSYVSSIDCIKMQLADAIIQPNEQKFKISKIKGRKNKK